MQIGKLNLYTNKKAENTNNKISNKSVTNPFGVSFKGNVIQADVFESKKQSSNIIAEKGKIFASAVVSGINNFNDSFKSGINAIVSFGKKITSNVSDTIEKIGNTEISIDIDSIKNRLFPDREYSVKNLSNKSVDELNTIWSDLIKEYEELEGDY